MYIEQLNIFGKIMQTGILLFSIGSRQGVVKDEINEPRGLRLLYTFELVATDIFRTNEKNSYPVASCRRAKVSLLIQLPDSHSVTGRPTDPSPPFPVVTSQGKINKTMRGSKF